MGWRGGYWLVPLCWALLVIHLSPRFGAEYSPDSFGYYLLGTHLVSGLGYVSQAIRDFYLPVSADFYQASRSFPPLMPLAVGLVDRVTGLGITAGLIVNLFVLLAVFHVHFLLSRRLAGRWFWLPFLALPYFILRNDSKDSFVAEIVAGRAIPLAVLLYLSITLIVCAGGLERRRAALLGMVMGLLCLTRFDALLFCASLIACMAMLRWKGAPWTVLGMLLVMGPWMIRNLLAFGDPFASDNAMTILSTYPSMVQTSWFETRVPTLADDPVLWAAQRAEYLSVNTRVLLESLAPLGGVVAVLISVLGPLGTNMPGPARTFVALAWLWVLSNLLVVSLTPYHDARYFSLSAALLGISALLTLIYLLIGGTRMTPAPADPERADPAQGRQSLSRGFGLCVASVAVIWFVGPRIQAGDLHALAYQRLFEAFRNEVPQGDLVAYGAAERLACYSTWRTIYLPRNAVAPDKTFISWKTKLNVRYAILAEDSRIASHPGVVIRKRAYGVVLADLTGLKET